MNIKTFSENLDENWAGKFYVSRPNDGASEYLHKDGIWRGFAGENARYDTYIEAQNAINSLDQVQYALELLVKYYSKPALTIDVDRMKLLNKPLGDILTDFKKGNMK